MIGGATVTRAGGTVLQLRVSDPVFRGDTIATSAGGQACIRFIDGTAFNLSNSARLTLQEFPFAGGWQPALLDVARGDFAFIAGELAKAGRLAIDTLAIRSFSARRFSLRLIAIDSVPIS